MSFPKILKRELSGIAFKEIPGDADAPSVILFHGYGADENDLLSLSQAAIGTKLKPTFYFPRGPLEIPIAPGYNGRGWFPIDIELLKAAVHENHPEKISQAFEEFSSIRKICESLIEELNIPLSKLFIGGFSQGAILAIDIALNARENVAGLLIFSGALIKDSKWEKLVSKHQGMHFFQSHGKHDSLLPLSQAKTLTQMFLENKCIGDLHTFEGGHEIPHAVILKLNAFFRKLIP